MQGRTVHSRCAEHVGCDGVVADRGKVGGHVGGSRRDRHGVGEGDLLPPRVGLAGERGGGEGGARDRPQCPDVGAAVGSRLVEADAGDVPAGVGGEGHAKVDRPGVAGVDGCRGGGGIEDGARAGGEGSRRRHRVGSRGLRPLTDGVGRRHAEGVRGAVGQTAHGGRDGAGTHRGARLGVGPDERRHGVAVDGASPAGGGSPRDGRRGVARDGAHAGGCPGRPGRSHRTGGGRRHPRAAGVGGADGEGIGRAVGQAAHEGRRTGRRAGHRGGRLGGRADERRDGVGGDGAPPVGGSRPGHRGRRVGGGGRDARG